MTPILAATDTLRTAAQWTCTRTAPIPGAYYRPFTREQSSAIANIHLECVNGADGFVEIIYHSNTSKAYGFDATETFCSILLDVISHPDLAPYGKRISLGSLLAQAKKAGLLTPIPVEV